MKTEPIEFKKVILPHVVIIVILLGLSAYAMTFLPSTTATSGGSYEDLSLRKWMIAIGILLPVTSLILCITTLYRNIINSGSFDSLFSRGRQHYIVAASATLAAFSIGWRCFPYWVNGVYQMDLGNAEWMDMDPKRLLPMGWVGEIWRLGVLLLALVTFIGIPVLLAISIRLAFLKQLPQLFYTIAFCSIAIAFHFLFQKEYMAWLLD